MDFTPISLIERLQQKEPLAWDRFVDLFAPLLDLWAGRLGLSSNDADDLVQEVFVILLRRMPQFAYDPRQSFRGWLWTVMSNA